MIDQIAQINAAVSGFIWGVPAMATMDLGLLWDIAETFNGLMAIPNLIALLLLSTHVKNLALDVDKAQKDGTICEKDTSI